LKKHSELQLHKVPKVFQSIKGKLISISLLLLAIPLLILGIFSYVNSARSLEELGKTNVKNSVEMTIEMIEEVHRQERLGNLTLSTAEEMVRNFILGKRNSDGTRSMTNNIDLGENGYLFILDQEGTFVAHPYLEGRNFFESNSEKEIEIVKNLLAAGAKEDGDFVYFDYQLPTDENRIEKKINFAKNDPYWGWTIVGGIYLIDFNKPTQALAHVVTIVSGIMLTIGSIVIFRFSNRISKPIRNVTERMKKLSEGDLSGEALICQTKDEVGLMIEAMNHLQDRLKQIVTEITHSTHVISKASDHLSQSAEAVQISSEQIVATMQELASGAENQANTSSKLS